MSFASYASSTLLAFAVNSKSPRTFGQIKHSYLHVCKCTCIFWAGKQISFNFYQKPTLHRIVASGCKSTQTKPNIISTRLHVRVFVGVWQTCRSGIRQCPHVFYKSKNFWEFACVSIAIVNLVTLCWKSLFKFLVVQLVQETQISEAPLNFISCRIGSKFVRKAQFISGVDPLDK